MLLPYWLDELLAADAAGSEASNSAHHVEPPKSVRDR
jgi:hypothetical protein